MAETLLNRARLVIPPNSEPYSKANNQSQILLDGVVATAPLVALAYSYAVLEFDGNSTHSGNKITVECDGNNIVVTLDSNGKASSEMTCRIKVCLTIRSTAMMVRMCKRTASVVSLI